jgi:hypothetical protein
MLGVAFTTLRPVQGGQPGLTSWCFPLSDCSSWDLFFKGLMVFSKLKVACKIIAIIVCWMVVVCQVCERDVTAMAEKRPKPGQPSLTTAFTHCHYDNGRYKRFAKSSTTEKTYLSFRYNRTCIVRWPLFTMTFNKRKARSKPSSTHSS